MELNIELEVGIIMNNFPDTLQSALKELSLEHRVTLLKETHYEAINRELQWLKEGKLHRLDFNLDVTNQSITVTLYIEEYPLIFSRVLIWWNNFIRLFPYRAKIKWSSLTNLPVGLTQDEYKEKIKEIINHNAVC